VRTVGLSTDGHGRATPAACSGLTRAAEPGVIPVSARLVPRTGDGIVPVAITDRSGPGKPKLLAATRKPFVACSPVRALRRDRAGGSAAGGRLPGPGYRTAGISA